ncbi:Udp-glycosyltransferase 85a8 [Thalictrum thalictroides]|uniref:Udp-glycosyltransferase 85a8 n=1 Tax=Thalictrum thalictroides TaxID=46969 RepID=A0A7J6W2L9_THATH|nr:Udp-glycosyltransferase 85a8 [Thalictrum thalictroides]
MNDVTNGYLETPIDWIPGMKDIRLRDLPSFIRTTDPNDIMIKFALREVERTYKASAIVLNTFDELELDVLNAMKSELPPVYTIGSLHMLVNQISDSGLNSIESNLWKLEAGYLQWLDSKEDNSVVYVNFGSITVMTPQQMIEFAWGLANSNQTFLWIIRPDIVSGDSAILPHEFLMDTKERGLLASMEIDNNVKRNEVESLVRELMEGEKGKEMKLKAMEWKMKAEEATSPTGLSYKNIDKLVKEILTL